MTGYVSSQSTVWYRGRVSVVCVCIYMRACVRAFMRVYLCFVGVWDKVPARKITNREYTVWTIHRVTYQKNHTQACAPPHTHTYTQTHIHTHTHTYIYNIYIYIYINSSKNLCDFT